MFDFKLFANWLTDRNTIGKWRTWRIPKLIIVLLATFQEQTRLKLPSVWGIKLHLKLLTYYRAQACWLQMGRSRIVLSAGDLHTDLRVVKTGLPVLPFPVQQSPWVLCSHHSRTCLRPHSSSCRRPEFSQVSPFLSFLIFLCSPPSDNLRVRIFFAQQSLLWEYWRRPSVCSCGHCPQFHSHRRVPRPPPVCQAQCLGRGRVPLRPNNLTNFPICQSDICCRWGFLQSNDLWKNQKYLLKQPFILS